MSTVSSLTPTLPREAILGKDGRKYKSPKVPIQSKSDWGQYKSPNQELESWIGWHWLLLLCCQTHASSWRCCRENDSERDICTQVHTSAQYIWDICAQVHTRVSQKNFILKFRKRYLQDKCTPPLFRRSSCQDQQHQLWSSPGLKVKSKWFFANPQFGQPEIYLITATWRLHRRRFD